MKGSKGLRAAQAGAADQAQPANPARHSPSAWQAWRICDGRFDPFSAVGASLVGGRWNSPGVALIYCAQTYAGAMLEVLAHASIGRVPRTHVALAIHIPAEVQVLDLPETSLPAAWDCGDLNIARALGDAWVRERRSAILRVPSVVARRECNVLINPAHPQFGLIRAGAPEPVQWDARLAGRY